MNFDHRNPRLRRGFAFVALAALLGLFAIGLTQCRMVNDTVTGVDLSAEGTNARSACIRQCIDKYKTCLRNEQIRHKAALRACSDDDDDDGHGWWGSKQCRKDENRKHKLNKLICLKQLFECKKGCYNEGAGSAR